VINTNGSVIYPKNEKGPHHKDTALNSLKKKHVHFGGYARIWQGLQ